MQWKKTDQNHKMIEKIQNYNIVQNIIIMGWKETLRIIG